MENNNNASIKSSLLETLKVVKRNHYTKNESDSKFATKDEVITSVNGKEGDVVLNAEDVGARSNDWLPTVDEIGTYSSSDIDAKLLNKVDNSTVEEIKLLIPSQATGENKLADKDFVNSSIATNTATFKGTYTNTGYFPYEGVDENDYVFLDTNDFLGNRTFDRYKYSNGEWVYEYTLNNSSFTEEQWKAINSGATVELINQILTNQESINNKVDKVEGKGLSTNDFTNEYKEKLDGLKSYSGGEGISISEDGVISINYPNGDEVAY